MDVDENFINNMINKLEIILKQRVKKIKSDNQEKKDKFKGRQIQEIKYFNIKSFRNRCRKRNN